MTRKLFGALNRVIATRALPFRVPLDMDVKVFFDNEVEVSGDIPLETEIELDTEIETTLPMLGKLRIPVKGRIPIRITVPVRNRMKAKIEGLTARVRDEVTVSMPLGSRDSLT